MKKALIICLLATTIGDQVCGEEVLDALPVAPEQCADLNSAAIDGIGEVGLDDTAIVGINSRYQARYEELANRAEQIDDDFSPTETEVMINADIDISWEKTEIVFDTPSVDMKRQEWKFDVPKTYFKNREFSFDVPEFKWGRTNIGPIKLDLPKIYSKRVKFSTKIPEFRWDRTSVVLDVPEFYMHRQHIKLHLPQIRVENVRAQAREMEQEAEAIDKEIKKTRVSHQEELRYAVALAFNRAEGNLDAQKVTILRRLDDALTCLDYGIAVTEYYGINPERVRNEDGTYTNLVAQREHLATQKGEVVPQIEQALTQLREKRDSTVKNLDGMGV